MTEPTVVAVTLVSLTYRQRHYGIGARLLLPASVARVWARRGAVELLDPEDRRASTQRDAALRAAADHPGRARPHGRHRWSGGRRRAGRGQGGRLAT